VHAFSIDLNKKWVFLNNIFNRNEFEFFGNGVIVEPARECRCYFRLSCGNKDYSCLEFITLR
jgi:heptosyltransferase-2